MVSSLCGTSDSSRRSTLVRTTQNTQHASNGLLYHPLSHVIAGKRILLIWDQAPGHKDKRVQEFIAQARHDDWLRVAYIPGGLTSLMQVCDIVCNKDLKAMIKSWYRAWKTKVVKSMPLGHMKLKLPRDEFIVALENIFREYNAKERSRPTIKPCFAKVGMNIFSDDMEPFKLHLKNLASHNVFKALVAAHLENAQGVELDSFIEMGVALLQLADEDARDTDDNDATHDDAVDSTDADINEFTTGNGWSVSTDEETTEAAEAASDVAAATPAASMEEVAAADSGVAAAVAAMVESIVADWEHDERVHEDMAARFNDGTAFGPAMSPEEQLQWAAENLEVSSDDDLDL